MLLKGHFNGQRTVNEASKTQNNLLNEMKYNWEYLAQYSIVDTFSEYSKNLTEKEVISTIQRIIIIVNEFSISYILQKLDSIRQILNINNQNEEDFTMHGKYLIKRYFNYVFELDNNLHSQLLLRLSQYFRRETLIKITYCQTAFFKFLSIIFKLTSFFYLNGLKLSFALDNDATPILYNSNSHYGISFPSTSNKFIRNNSNFNGTKCIKLVPSPQKSNQKSDTSLNLSYFKSIVLFLDEDWDFENEIESSTTRLKRRIKVVRDSRRMKSNKNILPLTEKKTAFESYLNSCFNTHQLTLCSKSTNCPYWANELLKFWILILSGSSFL